MYLRSANYYDAIYHFRDYAAQARFLHHLIQQTNAGARTLLDVACGTGKHLEQLQDQYEAAGLDLSPDLLALARTRCPAVPFHQGNMTDFDLGRRFDVVTCLFSSIAFLHTVDEMEAAIASMGRHLATGGLLIVEPGFTPENYWKHRIVANYVDEPGLKIAWMYTSEQEGSCSIYDINFLVGTPQGVEHFVERHKFGLFTDQELRKAFRQAGLDVSFDLQGVAGRGLYMGTKHED